MKTIAVFIALVAVALAAPQQAKYNEAKILKETPHNNVGFDGYNYSYEQDDGQKREESAQVENQGPEKAVLRVKGSYSYFNPYDGQTYTITYIADENGFQPQGAHIPVA